MLSNAVGGGHVEFVNCTVAVGNLRFVLSRTGCEQTYGFTTTVGLNKIEAAFTRAYKDIAKVTQFVSLGITISIRIVQNTRLLIYC